MRTSVSRSGRCTREHKLRQQTHRPAAGSFLRPTFPGRSGDVEVRTLVEEALESWGFFPVIVAGEPTPARVRVTLCES